MTKNTKHQWVPVNINRNDRSSNSSEFGFMPVAVDKVGDMGDVDHGFRSSEGWREEFEAGYKRFCIKHQLPIAGWGKDAFDFANYDNAKEEVLPHPDECLRDADEDFRPSIVNGFDENFDQIAAA